MPKTPPKPPRNKNEISPNNRSKCHRCGIKIVKGEQRYGVVENNEYGRTQRYYHPKCCPESAKRKIPSSLEESTVLNTERSDLYEMLRRLRILFADELAVEPFRIFHNRSLEELVTNMPSTESELLNIWGIKEKKVQCFGSAILTVIRQYKKQYNQNTGASTSTTKGKKQGEASTNHNIDGNPKKRRRKAASTTKRGPKSGAEGNTGENDDDKIIEVGKTLTCEEIVAAKFKHAQDNGYMISVD